MINDVKYNIKKWNNIKWYKLMEYKHNEIVVR